MPDLVPVGLETLDGERFNIHEDERGTEGPDVTRRVNCNRHGPQSGL